MGYIPGPGAYDPSVENVREKVKNTLLTSRPTDKQEYLSPGPGAYVNEQDDDKPKYTFGGKTHKDKPETWKPGPGQYDPNIDPVKQSYGKAIITSRK